MIAYLLPLLLASDPVVPIAGRPVDFSGAVGGPFVVTMKLDKSEVRVEEPVTLTITITGPGDLSKVKRPNLKVDSEWNQGFVIDDGIPRKPSHSSSIVWQFTLRPREIGIQALPRVRFSYFNPAIVPSAKGWQTAFSDEIKVEVTAVETISHVKSPELIAWAKQIRMAYDENPDLGLRMKYWWLSLLGQKTAYRDRMIDSVVSVEANDYPNATWNLLRQLVDDPSNSQNRYGLRLLRSTVEYPSSNHQNLLRPETDWWPHWLFHSGFKIAGTFAAVLIVARFVCAKHRKSTWCWPLHCVFILALLIPIIGAAVSYSRKARWESSPICVIRTATDLREGNGTDYPAKLQLPIGVEARLIGHRSDWVQLEFASGLVGWVHKNNLICNR